MQVESDILSPAVLPAPGSLNPFPGFQKPGTRGAPPQIIDLSTWTVVQYDNGTQPNANWVLSDNNTTATQTVNADPSIFLSSSDTTNTIIEGTWRVIATGDDDFIGFVFGYGGRGSYYLFDWKAANQNSADYGLGLKGMSVKIVHVPANADPSPRDLWETADSDNVTILRHQTASELDVWQVGVDYQFRLQFQPGQISIQVHQGATLLQSWDIQDSTYTSGRFGFYNFSQGGVQYRGFTQQEAPTPDLIVTSVDASAVTGDWQSLAVAGPVQVTISNIGEGNTLGTFEVQLFEDSSFNGRWDPGVDTSHGSVAVPALAPGGSHIASFELAGPALFRDNPLYAYVDSTSTVQEVREDNNLAFGSPGCLAASSATRQYTSDEDFSEGALTNLNQAVSGQLRLNDTVLAPFPYINIAATGRESVVRIDVNAIGTPSCDVANRTAIVGEYYFGPNPTSLAWNPSRTTVDVDGNVWCGDRALTGGTLGTAITKVGIIIGGTRGDKVDGNFIPNPAGQYLAPPYSHSTCIDRDGDGLIRTSRGYDNRLPWTNVTDLSGSDPAGGPALGVPALVEDAEDECILVFQRLPQTNTSRHVSVDQNGDVWVGGPRRANVTGPPLAQAIFWKLDGLTGARLSSFSNSGLDGSPGCGGYGGFIDGNDVLWSASGNGINDGLLRFDLASMVGDCLESFNSYGLAIDRDGTVWNSRYANNRVRTFAPDGGCISCPDDHVAGGGPKGVAASPGDGTIWVAAESSGTIVRLAPSGQHVKTIGVGSGPTGVAVDANGKVWVTNNAAGSVMRINPQGGADQLGAVDLCVPIGGSVYNYSDMTGSGLFTSNPSGTWVVIHDGGAENIEWAGCRWTSDEPEGTGVAVRVRAGDSIEALQVSTWVDATNRGVFANGEVVGRYAEVEARLSRQGGTSDTPVLHDLTIETRADVTASFIRFACAGQPQAVTARIGNGGARSVDAGVPVSFYDGDPAAGGGLLGTTHTLFPLRPGLFEDVTLQMPADFDCTGRVWVVAGEVEFGLRSGVGRVVFGHDVNTFATNRAGALEEQFAVNVATWLSGSSGGSLLLFESGADGERDYSTGVEEALADAGFAVTVTSDVSWTEEELSQFSAIFVGVHHPDSTIIDVNALRSFLDSGGGLYVYGGVGPSGGAPAEAAVLNVLTEGLGGTFGSSYNSFANSGPVSSTHPIFDGITGGVLACGIGQSLTLLASTEFEVMHTRESQTLYAARTLAVGGEPIAYQECNGINNIHSHQVANDVGQLADVSLSITLEYANTTYNRQQQTLVVQVRARNLSDQPVDSPLVMVIDRMTSALASAANPDGYTADGKPYYVLADGMSGSPTLAPGEATAVKTLIFRSTQAQTFFEPRFLAPQNGAPVFVSFPATSAVADWDYYYAAQAVDPDGHPITYALQTRPPCVDDDPSLPPCMEIDPATGEILWTPTSDLIGVHIVTVVARDGRGGVGTQRYLLDVSAVPVNRPPLFISDPVTRAPVGGPYSYTAVAVDPDGDPVSYSLSGNVPAGMTIDDETGVVSWDFGLPVSYALIVRADDLRGGVAEQEFTLTVGDVSPNPHAPRIFGSPGVTAAVNREYVYQPSAFDADPWQTLTFSLATTPAPPAGMTINPTTGRMSWTPSTAQVGEHTLKLRVEDGEGGAATQQWTITVSTQLPNRPPVIDSIANFIALVDEPYSYALSAFDPENAPITFSLVAAPTGMTIDPQSGLIAWTPPSPGTVTVAIKVTDAQGAFGSQVFDLPVSPPNTPPTITSSPVTTVVVGGTYRYRLTATDAENHPLTYRLPTRPAGMTINANIGAILWTPSAGDVGPHAVLAQVVDPYGGAAEQAFTVTVQEDTIPPTVTIVATPSPAVMNQAVQICVQAGDNAAVVQRTLTVDAVPASLNDTGCFVTLFSTRRIVPLVATATDAAGNLTTTLIDLIVADPGDVEAPTVELLSPDGGPTRTVTSTVPIELSGRVMGEPDEALQWQIRLRRNAQTGSHTTLASGSGVGPELLIDATLDPSLLPNDTYFISIWASDGIHHGEQNVLRTFVEGERKLGNFSVAFTDLTIPIAGIPLVITRHYDSLDTTPGDFGPGWRLGLPGRVVDEASENPLAPLAVGSKVWLTRPDGRRVGFRVRYQPQNWLLSFIGYARFDAEPGVTETLSLENPDALYFHASGLFFTGLFGSPFNPSRYVLTTKEGVKYTIDEHQGLQRIEDIFGNTIDVTPTGLHSSLGVSLTFVRDAQGRITRIIEPEDPSDPDPPGTLDYAYDPTTGNLVSFTTQIKTDPPTRYHYEDSQYPHYLTKIEDPLNQPIVRNVFDDDGRLIAQCDAMGDVTTLEGCVAFDLDAGSSIQTIINARGYRTDLLLDGRGNVLEQRRFFATDPSDPNYDAADAGDMLVTQYTYWQTSSGGLTDWVHTESLQTRVAFGQPVATLDVRETRTYDDRGNMLTRTEHGDELRLWTHEYSPACDKVTVEIDPMGNLTEYEYDTTCNLRFITDALGGVTEFRYNQYGQRTHFIDAVVWNGTHPNVWQFHYDDYGLPTGVTDPIGNSSQTRFGFSGELQHQVDRRGWRIDFEYDDARRVRREIWRPNTTAADPGDLHHDRQIAYSYNAVGLLTSVVDPDSAIHIAYWPTGLVKWIDNEGTPGVTRVRLTYGRWDGAVLRPGYDPNGNVTHVMDEEASESPLTPRGLTEYHYDEFNQLSSVRQYSVGGPVSPKRLDIQYYDSGLPHALHRFSDLASTQNVASTTMDYDCYGCPSRIRDISHERADGTAFATLHYARNSAGDVVAYVNNDGLHEQHYDSNRRLLAVDHPPTSTQADEYYSQSDLPHDGAGNRQTSHSSSTYTYGYEQGLAGNRLISTSQSLFSYDSRGNRAYSVSIDDGGVSSYAYDHRNRLVQYIAEGGNAISFRYDAFNRRIRKVSGTSETNYYYDGWNEVIRIRDGQSIRSVFTRSLDRVVATESMGRTAWYLSDAIGSAVAVVYADVEQPEPIVLDAFGVPLNDFAHHVAFGFHGRPFDAELGMYDVRRRVYDPSTGTFLQQDPQFPFDYVFGMANPGTYRDPLGETSYVEYAGLLYSAYSFYTNARSIYNCFVDGTLDIPWYVEHLPGARSGSTPLPGERERAALCTLALIDAFLVPDVSGN
jgi:RHS repeat-associated protein